jgi:ankyrin repeat protein
MGDARQPMHTDDERCEHARRIEAIERAFVGGDLDALRAAVDDPSAVPNGVMPIEIGPCLVFAVYRSPLSFIRTLLELGADPNAPVDDGFPPLIAALSCAQRANGAMPRTDLDDVLRLLLSFGADPNQRGINDYTPLHMAVAVGQPQAVPILLDAGADPSLRTRIDDCDTPIEMAEAAGFAELASVMTRNGQPIKQRLRSGLTLLEDVPGTGPPVRRQQQYRIRLRLWLNHGEPVRWPAPRGPLDEARLEDQGETLITEIRVNRGQLASGLFYGIEGMRVGGTRRLEIAPHLGYADRGVPGVIPPNAVLTAEITILGPGRDRA